MSNFSDDKLDCANNELKVIVTGSSGYVASNLIPLLKKNYKVIGFDKVKSINTTHVGNINESKILNIPEINNDESFIIINLASARFDFGATAEDYYRLNVECHVKFLDSLSGLNIKKIVHISSVAAIDGRSISFSKDLNCDDAYRSTKYLQEKLIKDWCYDHDIELFLFYPSAIFSEDARSDTNIGKLQSISRIIPFIPEIDVAKSLTYLPNFSQFIIKSLVDEIPSGKYLTIEKPSLTVSQMIQKISGRNIPLIRIPYLQQLLKTAASFLHFIGLFGRIDLKLTPNRVIKLFSDTSYNELDDKDIDVNTYMVHNKYNLLEVLRNFNKT
tara:strand:- start:169 stop:1155 length:987 start_codon:yes stop_codon:yes gene_type:complete